MILLAFYLFIYLFMKSHRNTFVLFSWFSAFLHRNREKKRGILFFQIFFIFVSIKNIQKFHIPSQANENLKFYSLNFCFSLLLFSGQTRKSITNKCLKPFKKTLKILKHRKKQRFSTETKQITPTCSNSWFGMNWLIEQFLTIRWFCLRTSWSPFWMGRLKNLLAWNEPHVA